MVHMDIKPHNILMTETGVLKIGDLGLVRAVGNMEDGQEGDSRYMALELLDNPMKSPALDMFSLGVMIWEIATGQSPPKQGQSWRAFRTGNAPEIPARMQRSPALRGLIRALLNPKATKRPKAEDVQEMHQVERVAGRGDDFLLKLHRRSQHNKVKRRKTGDDDANHRAGVENPFGARSSFLTMNAGNPTPLGIRIPSSSNSFEPLDPSKLRDGMCTPTDQMVSYSFSHR